MNSIWAVLRQRWITRSAVPGVIAVTHTGVPDRFCGQGIASQLTLAVLEDLKRQGLKVVPLCRFMARYILRHPEWKQMVADK